MAGIKEMSFWKWLGLLLAGFFLATLLYGFGGMVDLAPHGWIYSAACLAVAAAMVLIYSRFVILFEGAKAKDLPMGKLASHTGLGLGIGLGYFCVVTGIMALAGAYKVTGAGASAVELVSMFCYFAIVAVGEEIMFRGVLFRWLDEKWGFWVAILVSALLFGIIHITNPGGTLWSSIAIAIEAGLLLGAAYKWSGTLWVPIGIHWAWSASRCPARRPAKAFLRRRSKEPTGSRAALSGPRLPWWPSGWDCWHRPGSFTAFTADKY